MKINHQLCSLLVLLFSCPIQAIFAIKKPIFTSSTLVNKVATPSIMRLTQANTTTYKQSKIEYAKRWLAKAVEDLKAAKTLLQAKQHPTSIYHSHQTVEKSFKAYLALNKQTPPKIHDLVELCDLCIRYNKFFEQFQSTAEFLDSLGFKFRYPSEDGNNEVADEQLTAVTLSEATSVAVFVEKELKKKQS